MEVGFLQEPGEKEADHNGLSGLKVALIKAGKICSGVTGNTKEKATHPFIFRAY